MIDFRLFNFECLAQRWEPGTPLLDCSRWLLGRGHCGEREWAYQLGPFHFMTCRMVRT